MRCPWYICCLLVCTACSDRGVHSGSLPEAADFLPMVGDSAELEEQPRMVLRCEDGRLGAYLVVGTAAEVESGELDTRAVAVKLDSTPSC